MAGGMFSFGRCRAKRYDQGASAARATDGVQFVDENDGRGRGAGLSEEVTHPTGTHADDHFDELAGVHAEERHVGFAGDSTREERLTRTWRTDKQHTLWNR